MSIKDMITPFLIHITLIPALILCYAPAQNYFRFKKRVTYTVMLLLVLVATLGISLGMAYFSLPNYFYYLPVMAVLFVVLLGTLELDLFKVTTIFFVIFAFHSAIFNFSVIFDALRHPDLKLKDFSTQAGIVFLLNFTVFVAVAYYPLAKHGAYLMEHLHHPRIWFVSTLVSALFFIFFRRMTTYEYNTLHTNRVGEAYITIMFLMFILLVLLLIIYYFIVNALVHKAETDDRNRILEMQEKQYESLQSYIENDARSRHDFRQTIYALKELSVEKKYDAIDEYLSQYIQSLPQKETKTFCQDQALNAILNHYDGQCSQHGIKNEIHIDLPDELAIDIVDLCSVVGNILENAITACLDVRDGKRFVYLAMSAEQGNELYIAASNSHGGKLRKIKGHYLSSHRGGNGVGLLSITTTAERYGGMASFSHDDNIFYSDVMLKNVK